MQSTNKSGYNKKISSFIVAQFKVDDTEEKVVLDVEHEIATKHAISLQNAWRSRTARILVRALKLEASCKQYRKSHPEIREDNSVVISSCETCKQGEVTAELNQKIFHQRYQEIEKLLFYGQNKITVDDTGENWNRQFQTILDMPEKTQLERSYKYRLLSSLNQDFVNVAKTYAEIIISEYFLHTKNKSIVAKSLGGIAGGKKYMWRGILFKLADGSSGPWNGSDEAALKAAGHDLKGSIHYFNSGVDILRIPLMTLIDYKGFRMTAQAVLPLSPGSIIYGSADAGATVQNVDATFNLAMKKAARTLNICGHMVGSAGHRTEVHAAVDIEGHFGMDGRYYLIDLSRTFPPEAPMCTAHLNDLLEDGTMVLIRISHEDGDMYVKGTVHRAYIHGKAYDILFEDGSIGHHIPLSNIVSKSLSVFWRLLRPEYIRERAAHVVPLKPEDCCYAENANDEEVFSPLLSMAKSERSKHVASLKKSSDITESDKAKANSVLELQNIPTHTQNSSVAYDEFIANTPALQEQQKDIDSPSYDSFGGNNEFGQDAGDNTTAVSPSYDSFDTSPPVKGLMHAPSYYGGFGDDDTSSSLPVHKDTIETFAHNSYGSFEDQRDSEQISQQVTNPNVDDDEYGVFSRPENVEVSLTIDKSTVTSSENAQSSEKKKIFIKSASEFLQRYDIYKGGDTSESTMIRTSVDQPFISSTVDMSKMQPKPLSPDALTAFSNFDPNAVKLNQDVIRATERLIKEVIPEIARRLTLMTPREVANLNFSLYLHSHGVNMRHMGLIRSLIPETQTNAPVRTALLLQIIARTMKNILRDFQRRWMKSQRSTSEEGMFLLLSQFLNLIVGSHANSDRFWSGHLVIGIIQRFGGCAINYVSDNLDKLRQIPQFLKTLTKTFMRMVGLKLKAVTNDMFEKDKHPFQFEFVVADIAALQPVVKCMHIVDFGLGVNLQQQADGIEESGGDARTVTRLRKLAAECYQQAQHMMPTHEETLSRAHQVYRHTSDDAKPMSLSDPATGVKQQCCKTS